MVTDINLNNAIYNIPQTKKPDLSNLNSADKAKAEAAAQDFEAFFLSRMMESMFEGVSTDGMFGGGEAEKIYRSLLLDEYGKEMAKLGTVGLKDYVMDAILKLQENDSAGFKILFTGRKPWQNCKKKTF